MQRRNGLEKKIPQTEIASLKMIICLQGKNWPETKKDQTIRLKAKIEDWRGVSNHGFLKIYLALEKNVRNYNHGWLKKQKDKIEQLFRETENRLGLTPAAINLIRSYPTAKGIILYVKSTKPRNELKILLQRLLICLFANSDWSNLKSIEPLKSIYYKDPQTDKWVHGKVFLGRYIADERKRNQILEGRLML